jgi:acetyl-CoA C-acetyltransferase
VTAGNSSGITDGAAALVLTTARNAAARGWTPLARLLDAQVVGCDPLRMGLGPVPATVRLLQRHGWSLDDFDLFELNEAFAAQVLACLRELPIPRARLNVHGGAIALGHPIGATGARVVVTLLHALRLRGARRGLATLCVSGGLGMTSAWELV